MARLTRVTQLQFGKNGAVGDFGQFGSLAVGAALNTKDPATIQSLAAFLTGWSAETIANNRPALEDFNGIDYLMFYQLCYLFENGIPEWDAGTTYYINSVVKVGSISYVSLTDNNLNNSPASNPSNWKVGLNDILGAGVASAGTTTLGNDGTVFVISGTTTINNITIKPAGSRVSLIFSGILTVATGGNILLNNGAFTTVANATLDLVSDGTSWYELSRSPAPIPSIKDPVARTAGTIYQAATDGWLSGNCYNPTPQGMGFIIYTDSNASPTTVAPGGYGQTLWVSGAPTMRMPFNVQIKKGNYYQCVGLDQNGSTSNSKIESLFFTPFSA